MDLILKMLSFFIIAQLLGAFVGVSLILQSQLVPEFEEMRVTPVGETGDIWNSIFFIVYILIGALLFYFLIKYYKGIFVFRSLEFFIILFASSIVFFVILYVLIPELGIDTSFILGFILALILASTKWVTYKARNVAAILASAGVGAVFGFSLGFLPAVLLAIGLSVYDYIAVFKTKHMITFAKALSKRQMSFSLQATAPLGEQELKELKEKIKEKKRRAIIKKPAKAEAKELEKEEKIEKKKKIELGTGDLVVPIMLSVSAFYILDLAGTLAVIVGSSISLLFVLFYVSKRKIFLPALPPLATGSIVALAIAFLLKFGLGLL